jgi:hypothetical protein
LAAGSLTVASVPISGAGSTIERPRAEGTRSVSTADEVSPAMAPQTLRHATSGRGPLGGKTLAMHTA